MTKESSRLHCSLQPSFFMFLFWCVVFLALLLHRNFSTNNFCVSHKNKRHRSSSIMRIMGILLASFFTGLSMLYIPDTLSLARVLGHTESQSALLISVNKFANGGGSLLVFFMLRWKPDLWRKVHIHMRVVVVVAFFGCLLYSIGVFGLSPTSVQPPLTPSSSPESVHVLPGLPNKFSSGLQWRWFLLLGSQGVIGLAHGFNNMYTDVLLARLTPASGRVEIAVLLLVLKTVGKGLGPILASAASLCERRCNSRHFLAESMLESFENTTETGSIVHVQETFMSVAGVAVAAIFGICILTFSFYPDLFDAYDYTEEKIEIGMTDKAEESDEERAPLILKDKRNEMDTCSGDGGGGGGDDNSNNEKGVNIAASMYRPDVIIIVAGILCTYVKLCTLSGLEAASTHILEKEFKLSRVNMGLAVGACLICAFPIKLLFDLSKRSGISVKNQVRVTTILCACGATCLIPTICGTLQLDSDSSVVVCGASFLLGGLIQLFASVQIATAVIFGIVTQHVYPVGSYFDLIHVSIYYRLPIPTPFGAWLARHSVENGGQTEYAVQQFILAGVFLMAFEIFIAPRMR